MHTTIDSVHKLTDRNEMLAFLAPYAASSMFLLGNSEQVGLQDHNQRIEGSYLGAYANGQLCGVLAHYWNGNLVLQTPEGLEALLQALPELTWRNAEGRPRPVKGILGPAEQVASAQHLLQLRPEAFVMNSRERLFNLPLRDLKLPDMPENSCVRHFEPAELELFTRWKVAYNLEALNASESPALWQDCEAQAHSQIADKSYWLLEHNGTPVACSGFNTRTHNQVQIGGVWTPPELRGRGYARCVVAGSLQAAAQQGVESAVLFTDEHNTPARRAYQAIGFQEIGDYAISLLKAPYPL